MSVADLEIELNRIRDPEEQRPSNAQPLSMKEALACRDAGNVPDDLDRTLRLVLEVGGDGADLHTRRLAYEADYHAAPSWRRSGSKPVNVVPLRVADEGPKEPKAWWEDPRMAELEREWGATGSVSGIIVPAELRSFIYKTVVALQDAGNPITVQGICDSIARWTSVEDAESIKAALTEANRGDL